MAVYAGKHFSLNPGPGKRTVADEECAERRCREVKVDPQELAWAAWRRKWCVGIFLVMDRPAFQTVHTSRTQGEADAVIGLLRSAGFHRLDLRTSPHIGFAGAEVGHRVERPMTELEAAREDLSRGDREREPRGGRNATTFVLLGMTWTLCACGASFRGLGGVNVRGALHWISQVPAKFGRLQASAVNERHP